MIVGFVTHFLGIFLTFIWKLINVSQLDLLLKSFVDAMIVSLSVKSHIVNVRWVTVCFGYCRVARWLILCGLSLFTNLISWWKSTWW